MPAPATVRTRILILGGGFAGLNVLQGLEKRLKHRDDVEITLISRDNFVLFTPMLAEVAIGTVDPRHILTPLRELCRKTRFHRADVTGIDLEKQQVSIRYTGEDDTLTGDDVLRYDHLVLALGSTSNRKMVKGVEDHAFDFKSLGDAIRIRNHVLDMFERADVIRDPARRKALLTFSVIGGGYSGVELAAAMQEMIVRILPMYPGIQKSDTRVLLVEAMPRILGTLPQALSDYSTDYLSHLGIEVLVNTKLAEVGPDWIAVGEDQKRIPTSMAAWTTGIIIPPLLTNLPAGRKDAKGRPFGTEYLQLTGYENVWGIGDNILTPDPNAKPNTLGIYPATAQLATQQGSHLAENLTRAVDGRPLKPFRFKYRGEMVVLGDRSAVALVYSYKVKGFPAWVLWRMFYLMKLPRLNKRIRVAIDWLLNLTGPVETSHMTVAVTGPSKTSEAVSAATPPREPEEHPAAL